MKIALTGNPNSGKTTLFNAITGRVEHVGNWAGVTVEKKEGHIKDNLYKSNNPNVDIVAVDLPGAYSMSPFTSEEAVTREFIKNESPDVIINIVDSTNLSRSLFLTTQLLELDIPVVIALNKSDLSDKKDININIHKLSSKLNCTVVETTACNAIGLENLIQSAIDVKGQGQKKPFKDLQVDFTNKEKSEKGDKKRFEYVKKIISDVETRKVESKRQTKQDTFDRFVVNKWLGIPIFIVVMWVVFSISQSLLGPYLADFFVGLIDEFYTFVEGLLGDNVSPLLSSLLLDGVIGGVGAVVGFLPLIMVLFFLLALLEDCGYMARVAVVMDKFFKKVGLSGKSIIPMVVGTGCAIPGVMATRTIKNDRQRRTTAMLTPFMPCGAKLPVIALFAGVFFDDAGWVGTLMYFVGIFVIFIGALIIKKITGATNEGAYFIMELPEYKIPSIKRATLAMLSRGKSFIIKATTIILLCNAIVQIMQSFNWKFEVVAEGMEQTSILASVATPFAFLLIPLGFGVWQLAAASIAGFVAKENVVGTLAVVYSITNFIDTEELELVSGANTVAEVMGLTSVVALAYLMFNLFTPPCFAAIGAMNAEMEDNKWLYGGIAFQFSVGYIIAFFVYQIGTLITTGAFGDGFVYGLIAVIAICGTIGYFMKKGSSNK